MNIKFENRDLFTVPQGYYLAHCISADFALGAGIAKTFDKTYNMRFKLFRDYDMYEYKGGDSLPVDNVFNLVTKPRHFHKPTYDSLRESLEVMKDIMEDCMITKLAMPKIASGLDRLEWAKVYDIICEVFEDTDTEIIICEI
jgi:hypothetical protein